MKALMYTAIGLVVSATEFPEVARPDMDQTVALMGWAGYIECSPEQFSDPAKYWVDLSDKANPVIKAKENLDLKLEGLTLYSVPDKATITIEGQKYTADGTPIELAFSHPGTFEVLVAAFPYLDTRIEVTYEA